MRSRSPLPRRRQGRNDLKLLKPREKHYLGQTGIVGAQGDERSDGRKIFLTAVEQHAPKVLQDLSKEVFDRWNELRPDKGAPIPKHLRRSIRDWAIRWNLTWEGQPADWILQADSGTLAILWHTSSPVDLLSRYLASVAV